jgi:hypothetical protein
MGKEDIGTTFPWVERKKVITTTTKKRSGVNGRLEPVWFPLHFLGQKKYE